MKKYINGKYIEMTQEEIDGLQSLPDNNPDPGLTTEERLEAKVADLMSKYVTIALSAANWIGSGNLYSQEITISGITTNSVINLQPTSTQLLELQDYNITLMVLNDNGVATAYALNSKPIKDYNMKAIITETVTV